MVLFINCCIREEGSRTLRIAKEVLKHIGIEYEELKIYDEGLKPLDMETLNKRDSFIESGDYSDPMFKYAKQLALADEIVIAAPYWDLSFPSELKIYLENIYVNGIVTRYGEDGVPVGMCRAKRLTYVTTAGGPYNPDYSFNYISDMFVNYFGVKEAALVSAQMLDVYGYDHEKIVEDAIKAL